VKPRVVIVDDHGLFRAGVWNELGETIEVVGEAGSVGEAVPLVRELDPDVVLLDVHLPDGGGQAVIAAVAPERPGVRFLALSVSDAPEDVIAVIRAGARGYVTKTISGDELADAVRRVADGDAVFSPRLAGFVLDAFAGGLPEREVDPQLEGRGIGGRLAAYALDHVRTLGLPVEARCPFIAAYIERHAAYADLLTD